MDERLRTATRLWTLAQPAVSAFITGIVRDFRDRDDMLQEVAVAVIESFDRYDPERPFVPWAIGVARNQVGLYLRRRGRERLCFDTAALDRVEAAFADLSSEEMHRLDRLRDCVRMLDGRARRLCELRYGDDLKPAAIAPLMGMTANTVAKALQRVRDRLRECIEHRATVPG
jgi:RNA polymerase sigma-70 factor (ECF subfamily)